MGKMIGRMNRFLSTRGRRKGRKGSVLVIALLFASVLCVMCVAYMGLIVSEAKITPRSFSSVNALNLAEAGAEAALWELKYSGADFTNGEGWSGSGTAANPYTKTASLQAADGTAIGTYSITVADVSTAPKIEATGYAPSAAQPEGARKVRVVVKRDSSPFDYALFSDSTLTMTMDGNARTNSYNSANGTNPSTFDSHGHIGGNSNISLGGNASAWGNATPGPGCTVSLGGNAYVTGSTTSASSTMSLPAINTTSWPTGSSPLTVNGNNTVTLTAGTYAYTSINVTDNGILVLDGNVKLYVNGGVSVDGNGVVSISNNVNLCMTGNLSISGNGFSNTSHLPSNLMIYSTGNSAVFSGNAHLYGTLYAPSAAINLAGNGDLYGSVIGNSVSMTGNGNIHYDEALKNVTTILPGTYSVATWQEK